VTARPLGAREEDGARQAARGPAKSGLMGRGACSRENSAFAARPCRTSNCLGCKCSMNWRPVKADAIKARRVFRRLRSVRDPGGSDADPDVQQGVRLGTAGSSCSSRGTILDWRAGCPNAARPEFNRQQDLHTALARLWQGKRQLARKSHSQ